MVQRRGRCGGGRYIAVDELRHFSGGDVVDEGEGRQEENGCRTVLWWVGLVGRKRQVGGGEHEFLIYTMTIS